MTAVHCILQWNTEQYFCTTFDLSYFHLPGSMAKGRESLDSWSQNSADALPISEAMSPCLKARGQGCQAVVFQISWQPASGAHGLLLSVSSASQMISFKGVR